ncbi:2-keto-4-pentenoate hydratase [Vulcaniibacterium tengchongense]|uniref:2-keto-4-pentenoate hydratase n=1 Tax=Vulcaniibacterium tengchongense TaxID=1273429 RepID=A0A3N4VS90_9GAMM|nr:2-keto-4-pentenoate hydratase [Vulcaniibacterium tengchongense]RPE75924.1 2-keto-4-pentenoate hydratase [Vulcaniibacterium tengchongense]
MDNYAPTEDDARAVARRLVAARREARALPDYPGALPQTLDQGYACQDAAIALWGRPIAGWKVGLVPPDLQPRFGEERVVGPVFADAVQRPGPGERARFATIPGGFAAVEAEFVFRLGADAPADKRRYTAQEAADLADALLVGIELAGSPLPLINALGSAVVASDFGNNAGLVLGPEIPDWRRLDPAELRCETFVDGARVGEGGAGAIHGGLLAALAFALGRCAQRGYPLRAGALVTTGAATGIHDIRPGQHARVSFGRHGELHCEAVAALAAGPQA